MKIFKIEPHISPWLLVRLFMPVTFFIPLAVYWSTLYQKLYPGVPAALTAQALNISESADLAHPIFAFVCRQAAALPWETLPVRLNSLAALCGAAAIALFYLLVARIIFMLACEDSGGSMNAMPPQLAELMDTESEYEGGGAGILSHNAAESMPEEVMLHNRRAAYSAIMGAFGASAVLAFCGPFWFAATRLHPFTFDLMLLFLILNLIISYDQKERIHSLLGAVFLLAACSVESGLFLLLAPVGTLLLYRSMKLSEQFTTGRVLVCILAGLAGGVCAIVILWNAATHCAAIPIPAPRPILAVFQETVTSDMLAWIPRFGWSRIFVMVLLPVITAFFVFAYSFRIRKPLLFAMQLLLAAMLVPSLINRDISPWGIARLISSIPVYTYAILAAITGVLIASLHLMREMYIEKLDDELDFYEYRDNPYVCRAGALLCWPLLLLTFSVPYFSYKDIDPTHGGFTEEVSDIVYAQIKDKNLILDTPFLKNELLIKAALDGRQLNLYSTVMLKDGSVSEQNLEYIRSNPAFDQYRSRLINAAEISPFSFMREWLSHDPQAFSRIAVYSHPGMLRTMGYIAVPRGFFMELLPSDTALDAQKLHDDFLAFSKTVHPYMFPESVDGIKLLTNHRNAYRYQLAFTGNELAALLIERREPALAAEILRHCATLSPNNLSVLLNIYHLVKDMGIDPESLKYIEMQLSEHPPDRDLLNLAVDALQNRSGTLADPQILEFAKKRFWTKSNIFKSLTLDQSRIDLDPLIEMRNKKRQLYHSIGRNIQANDLSEADSQLNILLDIEESDHFALINKARVAILRKNIPEAGLWMDLAKEANVSPRQLLWHEAAILKLTGKLKESADLLNEVIPDNTANGDLWTLLAEILLETGDYEQLQNRVYPALRNTSRLAENYMFYLVRGHIFKQRGDEDITAARGAFLKALQLHPDLEHIQNEILKIDLQLDVPAFMESDARRVLIDNPEHPLANALMGLVRLSRGQLDLAEDYFARSLAAEITPEGVRGLAEVTLRKGESALAESQLQQALELAPDDLALLHLKTEIELALNKTAAASESFRTVIAGKPDDLKVRLTQIRLLIQKRQLEEAAMHVSNMLEREDYLPRPVVQQLKLLAQQISREFQNESTP